MPSQQPSLPPPTASQPSSFPRLLLLFCCLAGGAVAIIYLLTTVRENSRPGARYLDAGIEAVARKNPAEAEKQWLLGIAKDPTYVPTIEQLGDLYAVEQRNPEAITCYRRAVKLKPNDGSLLMRLARVEHLIDRDDLAYPDSKRAAELLPEDAGAQARYGLLEVKKGDYAAAIPPLQKALALHPGMGEVVDALVASRFSSHDAVGAERTNEEWLSRQPNDPHGLLWRAKIALQNPAVTSESRSRALDAAEKAYKALPDDVEAHRVLGQTYLNLNRPADAEKVFKDGVDISPFAVDMLQGLVASYARLRDAPNLQLVSTRLKELNTKLDRLDHVREVAILHHGKDLESNFQLAQIESEVGHFPQAQEYFNQLEKDAPGDKRIQAAVAAFRQRVKLYAQGKVRVIP